MDPSSPVYAQSEYFIQPDFYDYAHDPAVVHVDSIHNPDSRLTFGSLNTLQLTGGLPYYQPPSYIQSIRQHHPSSHQHSDLDERDSPMQSISPPLTSMSTSDLSGADSSNNALPPYQTTAGRSTGTSSPASSHGRAPISEQHQHQQSSSSSSPSSTLVHRRALRASTTTAGAAMANSARERRKTAARRSSTSASNTAGDDDFASDEDDLPVSHEVNVSKRREEVRKQRIESEQRRRDELRDGYRRLKDVLPVSNQKSSKVSLLDRATTHIRQLEMTQTHMIMKINELEAETARLRNVNETLMLSAAEQRRNSTGPGAF